MCWSVWLNCVEKLLVDIVISIMFWVLAKSALCIHLDDLSGKTITGLSVGGTSVALDVWNAYWLWILILLGSKITFCLRIGVN